MFGAEKGTDYLFYRKCSLCLFSYGQRPSHEIHFELFKKLHDLYVVEKTVELYAPLRGEQGPRLLQLNALWLPHEHGYQVAVYRQIDVPVASISCAAGQEGLGGHVVHLWVPYDLIRSVPPTAEKALEVMGGWRCDANRRDWLTWGRTMKHVPYRFVPIPFPRPATVNR